MRYLLLGAGAFGKSLAKNLVELGAEVLLLDKNEEALQQMRDVITAAIIADATEKEILKDIIDLYKPSGVVVCFGESFNATLQTVIHLKDFNISNIVVRASGVLQGEILKRLGITNIVLPETIMGQRVARDLMLKETDVLMLDYSNSIARVPASRVIIGKHLSEIEIAKHGLTTLFVHREYRTHKLSKIIRPEEDPILENGDSIIVLGPIRRVARFLNKIKG